MSGGGARPRCAVRTRNMAASGCALVRMRGARVHVRLEVMVWVSAECARQGAFWGLGDGAEG
jgi:hypothetical protein